MKGQDMRGEKRGNEGRGIGLGEVKGGFMGGEERGIRDLTETQGRLFSYY